MRRALTLTLRCLLVTAAAIDLLLLVVAVYLDIHTYNNGYRWGWDGITASGRTQRSDLITSARGLIEWRAMWTPWQGRGEPTWGWMGRGKWIKFGPFPASRAYPATTWGFKLVYHRPNQWRSFGESCIVLPFWFIVVLLLPLPIIAAHRGRRWYKQWREHRPHKKTGFEPATTDTAKGGRNET